MKSGYKYKYLTQGNVSSSLLKLALPSMFALVLHNVFGLVDIYFIGKLGSEQLAAVAMSSLLVRFIITFVFGASLGTVALVSRFQGTGNREKASDVGRQSVYLAFLLYIIVATLINIALEPLLVFLGAKSSFLPNALVYARIIIFGSIILFISSAINAFLRGSGDAMTPMWALIIAVVLNVILDPIFIFGYMGVPALGVAGSAIATVISRAVGMLFLIYHILFSKRELSFSIFPVKPDFSIMWRILRIGVFGSIQGMVRNLSSLALVKIISEYGTAVIAAYGVIVRLRMSVLLPIMGLSMATAIMVGQNLGAGKPERSNSAAWLSIAYGEILMLVGMVLFFFKGGDFVSFFNKDPDVIANGALYFHYFAPALILACVSIILERALSGAGDTISPMIITIVFTLFLRIGLALYLKKFLGLDGVWIACAISIVIQGLVTAGWFKMGFWKKKKV
ncbi:MAG: MATE family efflux transporter [Candidatus Eremiobacteraeota bacterium]|nr:MATE family efflux transporter [Candidatus Eremiobacteraeota bacterium]